ncbi:MAG TPA: multidrug DMT transporter permease, partial [Bryobacteraceae bacterium]|nr:multidrug DMT transporter permease [Bryobacteraceae bacterium]
ANTQKLAGRDRWPFPLYYWDYAIGVFLFSVLFMFTLGSTGGAGATALANLQQASGASIARALFSGVVFNVSNILLVVAIDRAGMSVAFPIGVGLALVIGTVSSYMQAPKGNAVLLFVGVAAVVIAMLLSARAYGKLSASTKGSGSGGVLYAVIAGLLMGFFYPQLIQSISPDFNERPIAPGMLTPYTALFFFGIGLLVSNVVVNTVFMRSGRVTYGEYFRGSIRLHSLGLAGGMIWMLALSLNVLASGVAGPAISYALGQGATLVAAIWGVVVWKEFKNAPQGVAPLIAMMFVGYTAGLLLIGMATL